MRIIQTKAMVKDGEVKVKVPPEFSNNEVEVVIIAQNEPDEFELRRELAKANGYDSKEKIMKIRQKIVDSGVKLLNEEEIEQEKLIRRGGWQED
jgi:hypothetical protein